MRARLRRNMSVEMPAEITGISAATFYAIEKGSSTVSIGAYAAVLTVLKLDRDLEIIALRYRKVLHPLALRFKDVTV